MSLLLALQISLSAQQFHERSIGSNPPSVLVMVLDDWGWTERSSTFALDALAEEGTTFTRFITFPVCSPSRYAFLHGRLPRRAGIGTVIDAYDPATSSSPAPNRLDVSLAEALKPTRATALIGKWHLGRAAVEDGGDLLGVFQSGPFVSGFDVWRSGTASSLGLGPGSGGYYDWVRVGDETVTFDEATYATDAQLEDFVTWWSGTTSPKFCVLAWSAPHAPFDAPPGMSTGGTPRTQYLRLVDYLNSSIAIALSAVDTSEDFVFVFGDNGTPNDARAASPSGIWKGSTYGNYEGFGGGVCTPLIVAGPGVSADATSDRLVSVVDIPATVLELVGVSSRGFEDSSSFADELGAWPGDPAREWVFTEHYDCVGVGLPPVVDGYDDIAIMEAQWKMRIWDADGSGAAAPITRYYDLVSDPSEQVPLLESDVPGPVVTRMQMHLAGLPARR